MHLLQQITAKHKTKTYTMTLFYVMIENFSIVRNADLSMRQIHFNKRKEFIHSAFNFLFFFSFYV